MLNTINVAVCDDAPDDRAQLTALIYAYMSDKKLTAAVAQFGSGDALLASDAPFDLVFLDIFMEGLSGVETAQKLAAQKPGARVVFVSSSNEFASESYDLRALYYLTKPLDADKLRAVLDRYCAASRALKTISVKVQRLDKTLYVSDIVWVEAQRHVCVLHTRQGDVETRVPFGALCDELTPYDFVKPIRYALVSLAAVAEVPSRELALSDGTRVPVAQGARDAVLRAFTDYKWKILLGKAGGGL